MVENLHIEAALLIGPLTLPGVQLILATAHDEQALVGHLHDIVQERVQHVRLEGDAAARLAARELRKARDARVCLCERAALLAQGSEFLLTLLPRAQHRLSRRRLAQSPLPGLLRRTRIIFSRREVRLLQVLDRLLAGRKFVCAVCKACSCARSSWRTSSR